MSARPRLTDRALAAVFMREWRRAGRPSPDESLVEACVGFARDVLTADRDPKVVMRRREIARTERWRAVSESQSALRSRGLEINALVAAAHGLAVSDLTGNRRDTKAVRARHVARWLHGLEGISQRESGRLLGGRAKNPMLVADRKIQALVDANPAYGDELRAIAAGVLPIRRRG